MNTYLSTPMKTKQTDEKTLDDPYLASSHYIGHYAGLHPEDRPYQSFPWPLLQLSPSLAIHSKKQEKLQVTHTNDERTLTLPLAAQEEKYSIETPEAKRASPVNLTKKLPVSRHRKRIPLAILTLVLCAAGTFVVVGTLGNWLISYSFYTHSRSIAPRHVSTTSVNLGTDRDGTISAKEVLPLIKATPTTVTARPTLAVANQLGADYQVGDSGPALSNTIRPFLKLTNTGSMSFNLSDVTLRYWYTIDTPQSQTYRCDYASISCSNVIGQFVSLSTPRFNADTYLEIGFKSAAGSLAPGATTRDIQERFNKTDWSNYNQSNDYSYNPMMTTFTPWTKVTAYYKGILVWGIAP